jgi:A/G-specific adenine glycosylase
VLVSEVMLQQTTAARVAERWPGFMARFPTPRACAAAGQAEVVRAWAGLGYNRRAVNLHRAARVLVAEHGGAVPAEPEQLRRLPGVGPYTARAVAVFAFERDVGVVDTNVGRLLARALAGRPLRPAEAQAAADALVPPGRAWLFTQALFDVAVAHCTARGPSCDGCPLVRRCRWAVGGRAGDDPAVGSAHTSRPQSRFDGSDRQGRGRLVAALRQGPLDPGALAEAAGWPGQPERAARVAAGLVSDGTAGHDDRGRLVLA